MLRKFIVTAVITAAALAVGFGGLRVLIATAPQAPRSDVEPPALLVRVLELQPRTLVEPIVGYGAARADRYAWITAQVAGELVELSPKFQVGALVEKGELLIKIDDRDYQRRLDRARGVLAADDARLKQLAVEENNVDRLIEIAENESLIAEREYQRVSELMEAGRAPRRELDMASQAYDRTRRELRGLENQKALLPEQGAVLAANRDQHRAEAALAELEVERCRILAPFDGRLETCQVEIGERVSPGGRLFAVLDPELIEIPIELPVSLRERVAVGAACRLMLESDEAAAWDGQVARLAPSASENTRTFSLFVEVDNARQAHMLMPGMFVRAQIEGLVLRDVIVTPRGVIQSGRVFVHENGTARAREINVVRLLGDQAVITGVEVGESVITTNLDALFDGAPVRLRRNESVDLEDEDEPNPSEES